MTTKTPQEITDAEFAKFGKQVAAQLGANLEWDSAADYLEDFATMAQGALGVNVGGQDDKLLSEWRKIADNAGVYYEEEE
jgi:hypothetical protein